MVRTIVRTEFGQNLAMTNSDVKRGPQDAAFGLRLKEHPKARGLTREELADKLSCSPDTIYKVEVGARRPSRQVAEILADFFSVPDDEREAFVSFARGMSARYGVPFGASAAKSGQSG